MHLFVQPLLPEPVEQVVYQMPDEERVALLMRAADLQFQVRVLGSITTIGGPGLPNREEADPRRRVGARG